MLISGKTRLERIEDVTTHPAFREAAQTIAELHDWKAIADWSCGLIGRTPD